LGNSRQANYRLSGAQVAISAAGPCHERADRFREICDVLNHVMERESGTQTTQEPS
jgi:hypothetical protein